MAILLQRPEGLEGWINLIVILLIIGGSILGPVAKWLIAKTSRDREDKPKGIGVDQREAERRAPRRWVPPARPVARPMPVAGQKLEAAQRPQAMPLPPRPVARPVVSQEPARPVIPPPPRVKPQHPVEQQMPPRAPPPPAQRPPQRVAGSERRVSPRPQKRKSQRAEQRLHVTLGEDVDRKFAKRDRELGSQRVHSEAETPTEQTVGEFDEVRHPTRRSLRQAILMSEILGPPLALRLPDDRF